MVLISTNSSLPDLRIIPSCPTHKIQHFNHLRCIKNKNKPKQSGGRRMEMALLFDSSDCPCMFHISKSPTRFQLTCWNFWPTSLDPWSFSQTCTVGKKRVRRLLPQPSGHTHSGDMRNMKPVCFSKKKIFLRDTEILLPEAEVSFQQAGIRRHN